MSLTQEQRARIRAEYSDHFFCRVVKVWTRSSPGQTSATGADHPPSEERVETEHLLALPKKHADRVAFAGRLDLTVDMLHGATVRITPHASRLTPHREADADR